MKVINIILAILRIVFPWGLICSGAFILAPNKETSISLVLIIIGFLYLFDFYFGEYIKK